MNADEFNKKVLADGGISPEMLTKLTKTYQEKVGLDDDGKLGSATKAYLVSSLRVAEEPVTFWKPWDGPLSKQPRNRTEVYEMFGNPGSGVVDSKWKKANIVEVQFELNFGKKKWLEVHKLVEPYLREALRRACIARPDFIFDSVGCFNFRHIRENPKLPLSFHSWGIAVDFNPKQNYGKQFAKGACPELWSPAFDALWPTGPRTIDARFIDALRSVGFLSGIDWNENSSAADTGYADMMHFEFTAGDGKTTDV